MGLLSGLFKNKTPKEKEDEKKKEENKKIQNFVSENIDIQKKKFFDLDKQLVSHVYGGIDNKINGEIITLHARTIVKYTLNGKGVEDLYNYQKFMENGTLLELTEAVLSFVNALNNNSPMGKHMIGYNDNEYIEKVKTMCKNYLKLLQDKIIEEKRKEQEENEKEEATKKETRKKEEEKNRAKEKENQKKVQEFLKSYETTEFDKKLIEMVDESYTTVDVIVSYLKYFKDKEIDYEVIIENWAKIYFTKKNEKQDQKPLEQIYKELEHDIKNYSENLTKIYKIIIDQYEHTEFFKEKYERDRDFMRLDPLADQLSRYMTENDLRPPLTQGGKRRKRSTKRKTKKSKPSKKSKKSKRIRKRH